LSSAVRERAGSVTRVPARALSIPDNPFPGLRPFREGEEHLFFGRESRTDAMVDKLAATRFLAVIGSSGSGKSSLVNCGLRVALRSGLMASAGTHWRIAQMRPGGDPIASLAKALAVPGVLFDDVEVEGVPLESLLEANLRMSRLGLVDVREQARLPGDMNLLVVVDQFEELFRYRDPDAASGEDDADDRASGFVNLLLEASRRTHLPVHVVLTMRSDFLGDCARLSGLAEAINAGQYLVPRMSREERRLAITGPVAVSGAEILPVLTTRLLNDLGDDPDRLPILQHALNRVWATRREEGGEGPLNLRHYSAIGSMANALDRHLEKALAELDEGRPRDLARRLFQALTDRSTDPRGVRRPSTFAALLDVCEADVEELEAVIEVFRAPGRSFLMPPANEPLRPTTVVDISHESLMRQWRRLGRWADDEAQSTRIYRRLAETAALHDRGEAGLWRDPDLALALEWRRRDGPNATWAARYGPGFERAMAFLEHSAEARERERARHREAEAREQELARTRAIADEQAARITAQARTAKVQRTVTRVIAGALVVSLGLAFFAALQTWSRVQADRERVVAEAAKDDAELERESAHVASRLIASNLAAARLQESAGLLTVTTLSQVILEEATKARALWQLAARGGVARGGVAAPTEFINPRDVSVQLLTWNPDGLERPRTVIPGGGRRSLDLFENDLWIARVDATRRLIAAEVTDGAPVVGLPE